MAKKCLVMLVLFCIGLTSVPLLAVTCESLSSLKLQNTMITSARNVPAGGLTLPPKNDQEEPPLSSSVIDALPGFCRVQGVIKPSSDSHIEFEVWLPLSGWNGKYQGIGNGGFAGSISYSGLAEAIAHNYATASNDTGHQAASTDARWALGHPEKIIDYGYRAIHETAVVAKSTIQAFYGRKPQYSYFNSCSNGGRQALMEAQRFPDDYDGIIAGAPANFITRIGGLMVWNLYHTSAYEASYISEKKLPAIQETVLAQCDMLDGVKDGILEDPRQCRFDPSKLLCTATESDRCLTNSQLAALEKIYQGPQNEQGGQLFPGYSPGGEAEPGGWGTWITGKESSTQSLFFAFGTQSFQNMVYDDPLWDYKTFDWDRDVEAAEKKLGHIGNAIDPDLTAFRKSGGKLIIYHGWNDAALPAQNTIDYYQSMVSEMGQEATDEFIRLFMVPGMQHCYGGKGCDSFGQFGVAQGSPESNISAALERWVEEGIAPDRIIAAKYKTTDDPTTSGIVRIRPLCPYPQVAQYKGSGSADEASNFSCVASE